MRAEVRFVVRDLGPPGRGGVVKAVVVVLVQGNLDGAEVVFQLLPRARPDDGARDARFAFAPGQGDLPRIAALLVRYRLHRFEDDEGFVGEVVAAEATWFQAVAAVFGGLTLVADVLAGEEAAGEGGPGDQGNPVRLRERDQLALDAAVEEVVGGLFGDEAVQPELSRCP